jgi:hypothetical protein
MMDCATRSEVDPRVPKPCHVWGGVERAEDDVASDADLTSLCCRMRFAWRVRTWAARSNGCACLVLAYASSRADSVAASLPHESRMPRLAIQGASTPHGVPSGVSRPSLGLRSRSSASQGRRVGCRVACKFTSAHLSYTSPSRFAPKS